MIDPETREAAARLANVLGSSEADGEVLNADETCALMGYGLEVLDLYARAWLSVPDHVGTGWECDLEAECMLRAGWEPRRN